MCPLIGCRVTHLPVHLHEVAQHFLWLVVAAGVNIGLTFYSLYVCHIIRTSDMIDFSACWLLGSFSAAQVKKGNFPINFIIISIISKSA